MLIDEEAIPVVVQLGYPDTGTIELRFPPAYADEVLALLDEHRLEHGSVVEASAGTQLWIEAITVIGASGSSALLALAAVIRSIAHRNDGKRVELKDGDLKQAVGYSAKEVEDLLSAKAAQMPDRDAQWRRVIEQQGKRRPTE